HPPRDCTAVESRALAVRVDHVDAESRDQTSGEVEVPQAQMRERKLDDLEAAIAKPIEEDPVARRADHELELAPRQMLDEVPDVLGPAAGARRHQELEDADGLFHVNTRRYRGPRRRGKHVSSTLCVERESVGRRPAWTGRRSWTS